MVSTPRCPRTGAALGAITAEGPLRCVRCQALVAPGEGPPGLYWCGSSGTSVDSAGEDTVDLSADDSAFDSADGPAGPDLAGARWLPGYALGEVLGRGGAGVVYRVTREVDGRAFALKLLAAGSWASERQRARFQREIAAMRAVEDPGVVPVFDDGETADGSLWYAMALVDGPPLSQVLADRGALPPDEAARIVQALAETLERLHGRGLFHRDVKPGNVLLTWDGRPLLSDFGLVLDAEVTQRLTRTHQMLGTPRYMAPEQLMGSVADWARADVYALGVVLYEALGGQLRRSLSGVHAIELIDDAPADLLWIARRASSFDPDERYPSAGAMAADLARWRAGSAVRRRPQAVAWGGRRWLYRNRVAVGVVTALLFALLGSWGWGAWQTAQREARADAEWAIASAEIAALRAAGDEASAEARFQSFAEDPLWQGSAALGRAWLKEAARLEQLAWSEEDVLWEAPRSAYGEAWLSTDDGAVRDGVLLGLVGLYSAAFQWDLLAVLLAVAPELSPGLQIPDEQRLRGEVALAFGEIEAASALLGEDAAAVLDPFAQIRSLDEERYAAFDLDGDGVDELVEMPWDASADAVPPTREGDGWRCVSCGRAHPDSRDSLLNQASKRLYAMTEQGFEQVLEQPDGSIYRSAQVGGRLFWSTRTSPRGLYELVDGERVAAHPPTNALASYIDGIRGGDLDGDGAPELIASISAPYGYAVRIYRLTEPGEGDAGGSLELLTEQILGHLSAAVVETPRGPRLAVLVGGGRPAEAIFSEAEFRSGRRRLLIFRLEGAGRGTEEGGWTFIEEAAYAHPTLELLSELSVADLNGDGRDDLVYPALLASHRSWWWGPEVMIARLQSASGRFDSLLRLPAVRRLGGRFELDGDPEPEWIWYLTRGGESFWSIAGAGEETLRRARPALPALDDEGAVLAALGLNEAAAKRSERLAASDPDRAADAWREAARRWAAADEPLRASRAAESAARASVPPTNEDLSRAVDHAVDAMQHREALRLARELAALDSELEPERLAWLEGFAAPGVELELTKPLDPAWQIITPQGVRHDMLQGALTLTGVTGGDPLIRLPLIATGGPVWIEAELDWLRAEWGGRLSFLFGAPSAEWTSGIDELFRLEARLVSGFQYRSLGPRCGREWAVGGARGDERVSVRIFRERDGSMWHGVCAHDGRARIGSEVSSDVWEAGERLALWIHSASLWPLSQVSEITLRSLRLGGVEIDLGAEPATTSAWSVWASGEGPAPPTSPAQPDLALAALLRLDPNLAPKIRELLGPEGYAQVFAEAWDDNASVHSDDEEVQQAMRQMPPLAGVAPSTQATLLAARGEALWRSGDVEGARGALRQAAELAELDEGWLSGFLAEALLAELALTLGEDETAQRHMRAAVDWAPSEALGRRMLQQRERLAGAPIE